MIHARPEALDRRRFDVIVIGGGIHGAAVLHEAASRGLAAVLLERSDFGSGASGNSLRILHGGLRYLQTLDLLRFRQSVAARRWHAATFPHLVRLLPCAMPLYGKGSRRRQIMRVALTLNDVLSGDRNRDLPAHLRMPRSRTCGRGELQALWPDVPQPGLEGGALWYDYMMRSSERVLIETLQASVRLGSAACRNAPVERVVSESGHVTGVEVDTASGPTRFEAPVVFNCTGSDARGVAGRADRDVESLFRPSLAFNLLLSRRVASRHALAVAPMSRGNPVYFVIPQGDSTLAGTVHRPRPAGTTRAEPTLQEIDAFLADLNDAVPGLDADRSHVSHVFAGLLPVTGQGDVQLTKREVLHDHGSAGGPRGFYSLTGIKYTTSREVARQALDGAHDRRAAAKPLSAPESPPLLLDAEAFMQCTQADASRLIDELVRTEAVQSADDVLYRRSNWSTTCSDLAPLRARLEQLISKETTR